MVGRDLGMFGKTEKLGLAEGMDDNKEERKKSKATPRYFGLNAWRGDRSTTY